MKTLRLLIAFAGLSCFNCWTAPAQSPPGPSRTVRWEDTQHLTLLWPTSTTWYALEYCTNLSALEAWRLWPGVINTVGESCGMTVPVTNESCFFRLHFLFAPIRRKDLLVHR